MLEVGGPDGQGDVGDPPPHLGRCESHELRRAPGEAPDATLSVEHQDGDLDRVQEVQDVGVDELQLLVPAVELVVHRGELLVRRLELLLGRLQLLVQALELLVAGDQLVVGGGEGIGAVAVFIQQRRHLLLHGGELLLQRLPGGPVEARGPAAGRGRGGPVFLEEHHERLLVRLSRLHREHDQVAGPAAAGAIDGHALPPHRGGRLARLSERQAQRGGEAGAGHLEELALGLPRRRLEVGAGSPAELEHLQAVVDDHTGRAVVRQHGAVGDPGQGAIGPRRRAVRIGWQARERERPRARREPEVARAGPAQEEPAILARRGEPPRHAGGALRAAEEEVTGLVEAVVGRGQHAPLQRLAEVDEDVPAAQQVELGEWRVARDIVPDEDAQLAHGRADAPAALGSREEALQPILPQPVHRDVGVEPRARRLDGLLAEVRAEDQDRVRGDAAVEVLDERDGQRVDLLTGGAPHHPGADGRARGLVLQDLREGDPPQLVEAPFLPEERGDLDEQVVVQGLDLRGLVAQHLQIRGDVLHLADRHAPGQPALEGRRLVLAEIDAGGRPQQRHDLAHGGAGRGQRRRLAPGKVRVAGQPGQLGAERRQGQAEVDHACIERALGHPGKARRARVLREGDPALRPDRRQPGRPVGGGAGEDHPDGLPAALGRQRSQEEVDGEVRPVLGLLEGGELQRALLDRHLDAGRDDVHPVRLDPHALLGLGDLHGGGLGERVAEQAGPRGLEVLHQDERQAGVRRHVGEELPEGVEAAGRGAHADDGEGGRLGRAPGVGAHGVEQTRPAGLCRLARGHR